MVVSEGEEDLDQIEERERHEVSKASWPSFDFRLLVVSSSKVLTKE